MPISSHVAAITVNPPRRANAVTIAVWIFAVVELAGIAYVLWIS